MTLNLLDVISCLEFAKPRQRIMLWFMLKPSYFAFHSHQKRAPLPNGGFHKWRYPKWMVCSGKSHLEMDDLGVPLFQETSKSTNIHQPLFALDICLRLLGEDAAAATAAACHGSSGGGCSGRFVGASGGDQNQPKSMGTLADWDKLAAFRYFSIHFSQT